MPGTDGDLLDGLAGEDAPPAPLAARLRPRTLDEFVGQTHLVGEECPLRVAAERGRLHSMILWGPPGVGKTTLAHLLAGAADARIVMLSAVMAGVKDVRAAVEQARMDRARGVATVLFVDEVHRFNKAQQDAFLPYVEDGTLTLVGATTENPSFEVRSALLSRARTYRLLPLTSEDLEALVDRAVAALGDLEVPEAARGRLVEAADGDARRLLNLLEVAADLSRPMAGGRVIDEAVLAQVLTGERRRFDAGGDVFYDQISALHKAVRGSAPDAALYWFARMLDGGVDPLYVARRVVRMASEDVGNADPRALTLALEAWQVQERLGSPEGELAIAHAIVWLACAPKSNAVYAAWNAARALVEAGGSEEVPLHLRNAPTELMKEFGHGDGYRYAHDWPEGYAPGEEYFPPALAGTRLYAPTDRGAEQRIAQKLAWLRQLDDASDWHRRDETTDPP
jgi:putative ATPase